MIKSSDGEQAISGDKLEYSKTQREKQYICLFCSYQSKNKLIHCPECGRNRFANQVGNEFICPECKYAAEELFAFCPECYEKNYSTQEKKVRIYSPEREVKGRFENKSDEILDSLNNSEPTFREFIRTSDKKELLSGILSAFEGFWVSREAKTCLYCREENSLNNDKCWSCGETSFADLISIRENRSEGKRRLKEGFWGLAAFAIVYGLLFHFKDYNLFSNTYGYLVSIAALGFSVFFLSQIVESYFRIFYGRRNRILQILNWTGWLLITIIDGILHFKYR